IQGRSAVDVGRVAGVVAEPHFGFRGAGRLTSFQFGEERGRSPRVVTGFVGKTQQHGPSVAIAGHTTVCGVRRGSLIPMAQYTKHPVSAPPTAPERESTGHLLLRGYATLVVFVAFAH